MTSTRVLWPLRPLRSGLVPGLLLAVMLGGQAWAQEVTGAIQGTVVSAESGPEPEVRVTLSGPNLQGVRQTRTDRRGFFQFLALPPGSYDLQVSRIGLQARVVRGIVVELGRTTAVPTLTLVLRPVMMEPVVTESTRLMIDPVHTDGGGTLDAEDYAALPVDRDYKSIITVLPGANQSYRGDPVNVGGSTGLENQYYIDGVNVTDTKTAGRATSLPYNFVRAVEVKTGGYEAQYGRALGAVVNAVTYSGTNDFEASAFGFTQPGSLTLDPRAAPAIAEQGAIVYDWGARVGGPLVRDRLWYSAAANPRTDQVDKEIAGHGLFADRTTAVRFASKLTWQASAKTNLELSVFGDPATREQVDPVPGGIRTVVNPDALLHRIESGGVVGSLRATVATSQSFLLQTSVARQWDRRSDTPSGSSEVRYEDDLEGSLGGGRSYWLDEDRGRTSLTAKGTLFAPGHTIIAGLDYEDARVHSSMRSEGLTRFDTTAFQRGEEAYSGTFHNRSPAAYLQDSWRVTDRLTLNPGLRWSGQYLSGASGRTAQRFTDEWQPRVGFSWQLGARGRQRILGSYGRFYQTLPTNMAVLNYVDYLARYSNYSSDPREPGVVPDEVLDASSSEEDWAKQIAGLQAENFDEFTLGYERVVGEQTKLTVRATRRDLRSSFQFGIDFSRDPIWVLGTPGEGDFDFLPRPKRQYRALEVGVEGIWRRCQYRASYVLSRSWGNYPGYFNSDFGIENPGGIGTFFLPDQATNSTGYLPNDRRHVFKLSGAWTSRLGLEGGAFVTFESGAPVNDFAAGVIGPFAPSFLVPRGTAGRTPGLWNVDLRFGYDLPLARGPRMKVQLDLLHVGNPRRATWVDEVHYLTLDDEGNPATPNPNYKRPTAYQPPMAVRLGILASF